MINRRRRHINETSFCRRYTDRREMGVTSQGAKVYAPTDMKVPPFVDPTPSSYAPSDHGGRYGGAGASGRWDSSSWDSSSSAPDFSNVDSGSSSTAPSSD